MARTKRSRRCYSEHGVTCCHCVSYRQYTACAYLIPYPFRNGNPIDSTGGFWTRRGFRPVAEPGRPWTESNPRWRGGPRPPWRSGGPAGAVQERAGELARRSRGCAEGRRDRFGGGCGHGAGGETRRLRGSAPGLPRPPVPPRPPKGSGQPQGVRRGRRSHPSPARRVIRRVCWLDALSVRRASFGVPPPQRRAHRLVEA